MKLIALVIKQYNELFKNQIFNFSDDYKVDFNFETNELKIDENPSYIENFYGESIYNISPIVGINGTGKTTVLNIISDYTPDKFEPNPDNQYFVLFELGKKEEKVRFKISSTNLSVATLLECVGGMEQIFYRNRDGNFDCEQGNNSGAQNILYVDLQTKGGGAISTFTTLNQEGLAMFIHSYLWLSGRNIISSVLSCSLGIEPYGLKNYSDSIPEKINAIGFLIYKCIHNIIYEEVELIKKFLSHPLLSKCKKYLTETVNDFEVDGFNLLSKIVKELEHNEVQGEVDKKESKTRKVIKEYVESVVNLINCFIELRKSTNLTEPDNATLLLNYSDNNKHIFEELNEKLTNYVISKVRLGIPYQYYLITETPKYHMSTGEGNLIEIFSQLYTYLSMHEESSEDIILLVDDNLSEILEDEGKGRKIQLIFTTHSPYMLSDIKPGNVIMIEKNQEIGYSEGKILQNTFAKNIQEIMKENLIDNIYGDFALAKINSMIERLNGEEEQEENEEELLKEIHLISEPILRNKLLEMYDKKYNTSEFSIEKQLQKLNLSEDQRQKVREMVRTNNRTVNTEI